MSCLRSPAIRRLVEAGDLQLGLIDEQDLAEITSPYFQGQRLVVCRNPALAEERAGKRAEPLAVTEAELAKVAGMVERGTLRTEAAIGAASGGSRTIEALTECQGTSLHHRDTSDPTMFTGRCPER